ncbi:MAG: hypothetical protein KIT19_12230 [Phycisphaeraceae bacterium]|nr:hypothetical protein [Phycisphaeraceae bacterium]
MEPNDPIQPEEIILRRVPEAQMNGGPPFNLSANAFDPHPTRDTDGLSVYRRVFHTPQDAADFRTKSKSKAWVAELPASAIIAMGLTIDPRPLDGTADMPAQPGHAVLRELNSANRKTSQADRWRQQLLASVTTVTGPYEPPVPRQE